MNGYYNSPGSNRPPRIPRSSLMRESIRAEQTHAFVRSQRWQAAVLPLGATEPHNLHLPYGTDTFQVETIGNQACARAHERGARAVLLPALPYGTETNQMGFPLAMNLNPTTVAQVLTDLIESLATH